MALQQQVIDIPFATGLSQKVDARLLQTGAQLTMSNAVIDKIGAVSKRPGTAPVTNTASSPWFNQVFTTQGRQRLFRNVGGGTALLSSGRAWAYSPTHLAWSDIDAVSTLTGTVHGIASPVQSCTSYDVAYGSGYAAIVYCTAGVAYLVLQDAATNAVVYGPSAIASTLGAATNHVRVIIQGGYAVCVFQDASVLQNIHARAFDLTAWTWGTDTTIQTDHEISSVTPSVGRFDIHAMVGSTTQWVLAYAQTQSIGVARLKLATYTAPLTAGAFSNWSPPGLMGGGATAGIYGIAVHAAFGERIWIAYSTVDTIGSNNYQRAFDVDPVTLAVITADFELWHEAGNQQVRLGIERLNSTQCVVAGALLGSSLHHRVAQTASGAAGTGARTVMGWCPASKPFTVDGHVCCALIPTLLPAGISSTYVVVDLDPTTLTTTTYAQPKVTLSPRIVNTGQDAMSLLPSTALVSTTKTLLVGSTLRSAAGSIGVDVMSIMAPYNTHQTARLGDTVYIAGGVPACYSGGRVSEIGYLEQVSSVSGAASAAAGSMAASTYNYIAVYEWIEESSGQRVQSAATFSPDIVVGAVQDTVTITAFCLHLTIKTDVEKPSNIGIALYRTSLAMGGVFRRLFAGSIPATAFNAQGQANITYVDQAADASIAGNEAYNTAQLANGCPPSFTCLIAHNGRLVGADGTDIWFSKASDNGTNQPQFSDSLVVSVQDGGDITALASMDGQLIIFKRNAIYVIAGDGPDANGTGNSWSDPQRIPSDVGCTSDWRSVLTVPQGCVFQSEKKLHILTRAHEVQYFSQAVEDELAACPVVTFAQLHSRRDEVRFGIRATETATTGYVLNWNYVTQTWSKFDYYDVGMGNHPAAATESAADIDGTFWYALPSVTTQENRDLTATAAYLDGGSWVTLTVEGAYQKPAGVQGFVRFWEVLASFLNNSPCDVSIAVTYDYGDTAIDVRTFTAPQIAAFTTPKPQISVSLTRQKAESIRVRVSDATPTTIASTTGSGPTFFGVSFCVGAKSGGRRLPPYQGA